MPEHSPSGDPELAVDQTLANLAANYAGASRVFLQHRLDFCCNGGVSLQEACLHRGLDPAAVLAELRREVRPMAPPDRWEERPLADLVEHLLERYHARHRADLPQLLQMAEKVERVHAGKASCPRGLAAHLQFLAEDLESHLQKEEQVLFPMLAAGHGAQASGTIQALESEHNDHGAHLARLRQLAHDFVPPAVACGTWRALYLGLQDLESALMQHIHLENHVLFPRVLSA